MTVTQFFSTAYPILQDKNTKAHTK